MSFDFKCPSYIILYGKKNSGKSNFIKWFILNYYKRYSYIYVFTATKFNDFYTNFLPSKYIINAKDATDGITQIMEHQKSIRKQNKHCLIVLDDILGVINFEKEGALWKELFSTSRHYNISLIISTQFPTAVTPLMRSNTDYAVFYNQSSMSSLHTLAEEYNHFDNQKEFIKMIKDKTKDYGIVVYNNYAKIPNDVYYAVKIPNMYDVKYKLQF